MYKSFSLAVLCILAPSIASATLLTFEPAAVEVVQGDSLAIDIVATPESGELIGAFDLIVNFDSAVLSFDGLTFESSLNDDEFLCLLLTCRDYSVTGGQVSLFEVASGFFLDLLQDGTSPVTLATMLFRGTDIGVSELSFTGNVVGQSAPFDMLADEFGIPLPVFEPATASVTVRATEVPEPPGLALILAALFAVAGAKWQAGTPADRRRQLG